MRERPRGQGVAVEEVVEFLRRVPPFQFLEEPALRELARAVTPAYFPAGTVILRQDGPPSEHLMIIKKGGTKVFVRTAEREEALVDFRGEGDVIGFLSLYTGDRSRTTVEATQDTICYLVAEADFRRILDANPAIREYLHRAFLRKYLDRTLHEMRTRSLLVGGGERLLFTTPVGELASTAVATAPVTVSIREAAEAMTGRRVSSLVLLDAAGAPAGIVTDRDIRDKVVAAGRDVAAPVAGIMSAPLVSADARDYAFEALLAMIHHNIHHLLVLEEGRLRGIITNHDLMVLQGTSPLSVVQEIEHQPEVAGVARAARKVHHVVGLLLKEGARAANVARVVTEITDRIVRRVLDIAEREVGHPPVPWAWLALGRAGRGEQVFLSAQDNALVYEEPADPAAAAAAQDWAARCAAFACDALAACGFPPAPEGRTAADPRWRLPLAAWQERFSEIVGAPADPGLAGTAGLFDFRVVSGDMLLGERLRDHVAATLAGRRAFFAALGARALASHPPIGFFGSLVVEKTGEHKDRLNLSARGLAPLVDLARYLALEHGVREPGTLERIEALRARGVLDGELADELVAAFDFLLLLLVHHQFRQRADGEEPDAFIDPSRLTPLEKRTAKEAFHLLARAQEELLPDAKPAIY